MEIWEPKSPGTLWASPGLLRDCFILFYKIGYYLLTHFSHLFASIQYIKYMSLGLKDFFLNKYFNLNSGSRSED